MLFNGKQIEGPNTEVVVIPRSDGDLVFKAQAVLSTDEFDDMFELPIAPLITTNKGVKYRNFEDKEYKEKTAEIGKHRTNWIILKSLEATKHITWQTIKMDDPSTWGNYYDELKVAFFSDAEINRIVEAVSIANGVNQKRIDEATASFLAGQAEMQQDGISRSIEQQSMQSGEHVKD